MNILIVTNSYPNYGGQSTTAYNLLKLLKKHNHNARLICINHSLKHSVDPENTGASDRLLIKRNILSKMFTWARKHKLVDESAGLRKMINMYFFLRLLPKMYYYHLSNKFMPDLVITNVTLYSWMLKRIYGKKRLLTIVGGSQEMNVLSRSELDANFVLSNPDSCLSLLNNHKSNMKLGHHIIFNSQLTKDIYSALKLYYNSSIVQHFNIVPEKDLKTIAYADRKYDIAFIASNFSRNIKNATLAGEIYIHCPELKKIGIGIGSEMFKDIEGTEVQNLITQDAILEILSDTRLLIIPSYFDSSPSILSEAISCGCNVLISRNVGWHESIGANSVVQNFTDIQEWLTKLRLLIEKQQEYSTFKNIINNSEKNIANTINNLAISRRDIFVGALHKML